MILRQHKLYAIQEQFYETSRSYKCGSKQQALTTTGILRVQRTDMRVFQMFNKEVVMNEIIRIEKK